MAMIRKAGALLALPLGTALISGCFSFVTKEEGQKMQAQIDKLDKDTREYNQKLTAQIQKQREELQGLIDDAKNLTRVLADSAQRTDKALNDLTAVQGRAEDLQKSVDALQKMFTEYRAQSDVKLEQLSNAATTAKSPPLPEDPKALFEEAQRNFEARQWAEARRKFDHFINRSPGDTERAATAQFRIGEAYFAEGKYPHAIGAFAKVVDNYPKSAMVEEAMFKNGQAFFAIKQCSNARIYFQELLRRYPRTRFKSEAQEQAKELTRQAKNKSVCES